MAIRGRRAVKPLSFLLILSVSQLNIQASLLAPSAAVNAEAGKAAATGRVLGRLTADGAVTVNGNVGGTGDTITSGSRIETPDAVGATIHLGPLGRLDISPNAVVTLNFDRNSVRGDVSEGCVSLNTREGIDGSVTTPRGTAVRADVANSFTANACTSEPVASSLVLGAKAARDDGHSTAGGGFNLGGGIFNWAVLLVSAGAVVTLYHNRQFPFRSCHECFPYRSCYECSNPSPCRPR